MVIKSSHGKFFSNELSLKGRLRRIFYRKPSTRLGFRLFDLAVTFTLCLVYVIRVELDDYISYQCGGIHCSVSTVQLPKDTDRMAFSSNAINWYLLLWVRRPFVLWVTQITLSCLWFLRGILSLYITPQGTRFRKFSHEGLLLDWICTLPYLLTFIPALGNLFLPGFLACWIVRRVVHNLLIDLHLTKQRCQTLSVTLTHQMTLLLITLSSLIFTTMCGIQHIQRGSSGAELTMFEAFYFVIVTFSTVGYGDISPDTWLGQLFMTLMIGVAFAFIPRQVEGVTSALKEMRKTGGEYNQHKVQGNRHVVLCTPRISAEGVLNFLIEFYAHPQNEDHTVVLMSSEQRDTSLQILLKDPKWAHRVIYMQGSALNDADLQRCRLADADACFILQPSEIDNTHQSDQLILMHYWAVRDFAPHCQMYVQLHHLENKMHVNKADHVVCADELKFAILANNCLNPGLSTMLTLLMHSTTVETASIGTEPWQRLYASHSSHTLYHIQLNQSKIFGRYRGWSFTLASADAHKRYGVGLLAVQDRTRHESPLQLNPGDGYKLRDFDCLFYMADVPDEHAAVMSWSRFDSTNRENNNAENGIRTTGNLWDTNDNSRQPVMDISYREREPGIVSSPWEVGLQDHRLQSTNEDVSSSSEDSTTVGPPPSSLCSSNPSITCHVMKARRPDCCLEWGKDCGHCAYKNARHDLNGNQLVILAAEEESVGMVNFFVPLRSHVIEKDDIRPIVLLLQKRPSDVFLQTIAHFPLIFWIEGSVTSVDDLIRSGIHKAEHLVVTNMQSSVVTDSDTLVAVQTIERMFPNTNIITELNQASNIRFMNSPVPETVIRTVARLEERLRANMSSTLPHLFRQPFAAGKVFSASMLDSLLYQTFVKRYLITFVRLLIGIDAENNTGHLSSIRVNGMTFSSYTTFGELYYGLASTTGEIPLAIYRTEKPVTGSMVKKQQQGQNGHHVGQFGNTCDTCDTRDYVCNRLSSLGMDTEAYVSGLDQGSSTAISFVVLNPTPETKLIDGDLVYIIKPGSFLGHPPPSVHTQVTSLQTGQEVHV
ncbi:potassium channel subfamily T member 1-like isoform X2 [Mizuhopecten yessoensis]|uniref:potassium channel subfamily T member 1-like isoform X2 n=1 Tax=Mizuhopecten yessoensis TaxID=6573 RepID=UPI000B45E7AF|nr:potassium channel subfamily T member 1-like isoform X2 [Mizuhopecten yessoensis]